MPPVSKWPRSAPPDTDHRYVGNHVLIPSPMGTVHIGTLTVCNSLSMSKFLHRHIPLTDLDRHRPVLDWYRSMDGIALGQLAAHPIQQHPICELAECEVEFVFCVALLRELKDQCRERLRQLEQLLRALIRGPVAQGTDLLKRLFPVAAKASAPLSEVWKGVGCGWLHRHPCRSNWARHSSIHIPCISCMI